MGTGMPLLETERLNIRPFEAGDLQAAHNLFDFEDGAETGSLEERQRWLDWSIRNTRELEKLWQPPFGDRAIVRKSDGQLVGSVGLVAAFGPYSLLEGFPPAPHSRLTAEVGLFWQVLLSERGKGYATEAARAVIDFCFTHLMLARIVAVTTRQNQASAAVMERLNMRLLRNPLPEPEWFGVVGVLNAPDAPGV